MLPTVLYEDSAIDFGGFIGSTLWLLQAGKDKLCRLFAWYFCCCSLAYMTTKFNTFNIIYGSYNLGSVKLCQSFVL